MEGRLSGILVLTVLWLIVASVAVPAAARTAGPTILVDFSHGQGTKGACMLFAVLPEAHWIALVDSSEEADELTLCPIPPSEVWVGNFANVSDRLSGVDAIIIGQPTVMLDDSEIEALKNWFSGSGKLLWLAGDSDYPAGGSELAQKTANIILEAIGSKLRIDYLSVEDTESNAGASYRVVGIVDPMPSKYKFLALGAHRVLFHGPGPVAWVDEEGAWHRLIDRETGEPVEGLPENIVVLVRTTGKGHLAEHTLAGEVSNAYAYNTTEMVLAGEPLDGYFPLMAAEIIEREGLANIILVSGETPYGGYQPMITYRYKGVALDGPRFIRNVLLWGLHYSAELGMLGDIYNITMGRLAKIVEEARAAAEKVKTEINQLRKSIGEVEARVASVETALSETEERLGELSKKVDELSAKMSSQEEKYSGLERRIAGLEEAVTTAKTAAEGVTLIAYAGIALGVIAIIIAMMVVVMLWRRLG